VGEDLREGKPTVLYATALRRATRRAKAVLGRYGAPDLDDDEIAGLQAVLIETGAVESVEDDIEKLVETAIAALAGAPLLPGPKAALADLAGYVAGRDR
jgi:geranylgeranyl diphosphate synthase type I